MYDKGSVEEDKIEDVILVSMLEKKLLNSSAISALSVMVLVSVVISEIGLRRSLPVVTPFKMFHVFLGSLLEAYKLLE
jgi:hypothetical protein